MPVAVAALVYSGGLLFFMSHRHAVSQQEAWDGTVAAPADLSVPGAGAPARDGSAARRAYADTLALYERQGNRMGQADVLLASAQLEQSLDQTDQALLFYSRSYALYREIGALGPAAQIAITMGDTLRARERFAPAGEHYGNAVGLYQKLGDPDAAVRALRKRGGIERKLGRLDAARDPTCRRWRWPISRATVTTAWRCCSMSGASKRLPAAPSARARHSARR